VPFQKCAPLAPICKFRPKSRVQIVQSSLEHSVEKLGENCLWMTNCKTTIVDGGGTGAIEVPKILEQIL
jgi:hypothetical protein